MTSKSQLSDKRSLMKSNRHTTSDQVTEDSPGKIEGLSGRRSHLEATFPHLTKERSLTAEEAQKHAEKEMARLVRSVDVGRPDDPGRGELDLAGSSLVVDATGSPQFSDRVGAPGATEAEDANLVTHKSMVRSPASRKEPAASPSRQNCLLSRRAELQPRPAHVLRSSHIVLQPLRNVKVQLRSKKKQQPGPGVDHKVPKKQQINVDMKHDNSVITEYELISPADKAAPLEDEFGRAASVMRRQSDDGHKLELSDGAQVTEPPTAFFDGFPGGRG